MTLYMEFIMDLLPSAVLQVPTGRLPCMFRLVLTCHRRIVAGRHRVRHGGRSSAGSPGRHLSPVAARAAAARRRQSRRSQRPLVKECAALTLHFPCSVWLSHVGVCQFAATCARPRRGKLSRSNWSGQLWFCQTEQLCLDHLQAFRE